MKRIVAIAGVGMGLIGCHRAQPQASVSMEPTTQEAPEVAATKPFIAWPHASAEAPPTTPEVTGVVAKKPFIALPHVFNAPGAGATPSLLLQLHARSDSPVLLSEYGKQKAYPLAAFTLRADLSADELQRRLGPPAQLADYSDVWFVYRLTHGKELWLHFSQPGNLRLLAADVVHPQEDGYTRDRVFSAE